MNRNDALVLAITSILVFALPVQSQEGGRSPKQKSNSKKTAKPFRWVNPLPPKHHPALDHAIFKSPSMNREVGYCILLPPDYESNKQTRYPVVYYLHGGRPGSETKSIRLASYIYDAWQADEVTPAIYVFVNGGPVSHYDMPEQNAGNGVTGKGASVFVKELIPHVDATYRTIARRSGRAIEGFSQGGRGTMRIALRYPWLFCSAAAGGGGYATEKRISQSNGYENPNLKFAPGDNAWDLATKYLKSDVPRFRLMIYVGDQGFNYKNNQQYSEYLSSLGLRHEMLVVPGIKHSAADIYLKRAVKIMSFHQVNFMRAATIDVNDGAPSIPSEQSFR